MNKKQVIISENTIKSKIYTIRGKQVMLDEDLAKLYEVETRILNQSVRRNIKRFPEYYMFQLTKEELDALRSQIVISKEGKGGRRYLPHAFTEQGVSQLSSVLNSDVAIEMSIKIIDAFVLMRKFLSSQAQIFNRLDFVERKQIESETKIDKILDKLEQIDEEAKQGIFFDGQIFDAYKFALKLIHKAKASLIIIDNFIDETVLTMCSEVKKGVNILIITRELSKKQQLDIEKYNSQHSRLNVKETNKFHDRFIIIDNKEVYHIGASLKDLGKKCFAFSKIEDNSMIQSLLKKLK